MNPPELPPSPPYPSRSPPLTPTQLIQTITAILTSSSSTSTSTAGDPPPDIIAPYIPHLTPPIIHSIISSKALSSRPNTLLSFFRWAHTHVPAFSLHHHPSHTLPSLLALLSSLFSHNKFADAKSLLLKFIPADHRHELHRSLLYPPQSLPRPSKALLDTAVGAYVQSGSPHLAVRIFKKMKRLKLRPNLLTCNTLLNSLIRWKKVQTYLGKANSFNVS